MDQSEARKTTVLILVALGLLLLLIAAPPLILGGHQVVSLQSGSAFGGQISQYLGIPSGQDSLAVEGKDFAIDNTKFFDGDEWVVVHFKGLSKRAGDEGYTVFQKKDGAYMLVQGPSTSFSSNYLEGVSVNVVNYLKSQGAVYESSL